MKKLEKYLLVIGWILAFLLLLAADLDIGSIIPDSLITPIRIACLACMAVTSLRFYGFSINKVRNGPLAVGKLTSAPQSIIRNRGGNAQSFILTIQFYTQEGRQITASTTKILRMIDLPQFQPGKELVIRYDPQNPQDIMIETKAVDPKLLEHMRNATIRMRLDK